MNFRLEKCQTDMEKLKADKYSLQEKIIDYQKTNQVTFQIHIILTSDVSSGKPGHFAENSNGRQMDETTSR